MTDFADARDFAYAMIRFREKKKQKAVKAKKPSKYNYEDIKAMREAGAFTAEIAEKYGVSAKNMKNYMSRNGIFLPKELRVERNRQNGGVKAGGGSPRKWDRKKVLEMRNSGMMVKEIAEVLGCTPKAASAILNKARKEFEEKEAIV